MYTNDWKDFLSSKKWLVRENNIVEVSTPQKASEGLFQPSPEFLQTFPLLSNLLNLARVTEIKIDGELFQIYGWTDLNGYSFGWQCSPGNSFEKYLEFHPHHKFLLSCFGGINERWNEPDTWLLNLNSALCVRDTFTGFGWEEYYSYACEEEKIPEIISPSDYRAFAHEANGNCTIYHYITGQALMFAHDHAFKHIKPLERCPKYTFYTINDCPDFQTWVETVAKQWLDNIG